MRLSKDYNLVTYIQRGLKNKVLNQALAGPTVTIDFAWSRLAPHLDILLKCTILPMFFQSYIADGLMVLL